MSIFLNTLIIDFNHLKSKLWLWCEKFHFWHSFHFYLFIFYYFGLNQLWFSDELSREDILMTHQNRKNNDIVLCMLNQTVIYFLYFSVTTELAIELLYCTTVSCSYDCTLLSQASPSNPLWFHDKVTDVGTSPLLRHPQCCTVFYRGVYFW